MFLIKYLPQNQLVCVTETQLPLTAPSGYTAYNWNTNPILNSPSVVITTAGSYTVTITDANGCTNTKLFIVTSSEAATITEVLVNDFEENLTAQILFKEMETMNMF